MIFIGGYHACGKTTLAKILESEFNCLHVETSAVVRSMWEAHDCPGILQEWAAAMEAEHGDNYFDEVIAKTIQASYEAASDLGRDIQDVVITGNRSLEGVQYLANYFEGSAVGARPKQILGIKTDFDVLLERFRSRGRREGDASMSIEDFRELTHSERRRGLEDILAVADYTLDNNHDQVVLEQASVTFFKETLGLEHHPKPPIDYLPETGHDWRLAAPYMIEYRKNV